MLTSADLATLVDRYAGGVPEVDRAILGITAEELDRRPAPGSWTAREIVHHLADSETNSYLRLRHLLSGIDYTVQPYDQDRWVVAPALAYDRPIDGSLAVLRAVRASSLELLRRLTPADLTLAGRHPEHDEPYSVGLWLQLYADHPHEHADQIDRARRGEA